jgi:nitrite reductase (NADH) large subunit
MVKDVGAVAIGEDRWEIYVGGAAGSHIRKGDVLCTVTGEDEVVRITGRFMQWYRENAKFKERTHTFIERVGIERARAVVVEDSDGIATALDAAMAASAAAVRDPWKERAAPKTENQFASVIPVEA